MVLDYNTRKKGIDLSDQLCSYHSPSRKTIIWYKKIAIDLMSIAIVNSVLIYNSFRENRRDKMPILVAYETLIRRLLHVEKSLPISRPLSDNSHKLEKKIQRKRTKNRTKNDAWAVITVSEIYIRKMLKLLLLQRKK